MIQIIQHTNEVGHKSFMVYNEDFNVISSWRDTISELFPVYAPHNLPKHITSEDFMKDDEYSIIFKFNSMEEFTEDHPEIFI